MASACLYTSLRSICTRVWVPGATAYWSLFTARDSNGSWSKICRWQKVLVFSQLRLQAYTKQRAGVTEKWEELQRSGAVYGSLAPYMAALLLRLVISWFASTSDSLAIVTFQVWRYAVAPNELSAEPYRKAWGHGVRAVIIVIELGVKMNGKSSRNACCARGLISSSIKNVAKAWKEMERKVSIN